MDKLKSFSKEPYLSSGIGDGVKGLEGVRGYESHLHLQF